MKKISGYFIRFLKACIPPILMKPWLKFRNNYFTKYDCNGLFLDLNTLPTDLGADPFSNPNWLRFVIKKNHEQKKLGEELNYIPEAPYAVYQTVITNLAKNKIHIIDIGGGTGHCLFQLIPALPKEFLENIYYTVIDSHENCIAGRSFFSNEKVSNIDFIESLNDYKKRDGYIPFVYISSTMQYIPQWKEFLCAVMDKISPVEMLFTRFVSNDTVDSSYASIQEINCPEGYAGTTSFTVISTNQFIDYLKNKNYKNLLNFKASSYVHMFNKDIPEKYRNVFNKTLWFRKMD